MSSTLPPDPAWAFVATRHIREMEMRATTKTVLLMLLSYASIDEDDPALRPTCWPSQDTLCAATSLEIRTLRKILNALEDAGLIEIERRHLKGQRASNRYWLNLRTSRAAETADRKAAERPTLRLVEPLPAAPEPPEKPAIDETALAVVDEAERLVRAEQEALVAERAEEHRLKATQHAEDLAAQREADAEAWRHEQDAKTALNYMIANKDPNDPVAVAHLEDLPRDLIERVHADFAAWDERRKRAITG